MSHPDASPLADYAVAVEDLAGRVLAALRGVQDTPGPAAHVAEAPDIKAALAAVRVLGPDVFAPALLAGVPPGPDDLTTVTEALRVFPPAPGDPPEVARLTRATVALLARHGGEVPAVEDGIPSPAPEDDADPPWRAWSLTMARLAPLTLPGAAGPLGDRAGRRALDLSRGLARSLMRRDYPTAARLARWVALARARGATAGLDIEPVVRHLELCGGGSARTALDITIARLLIPDRGERPGPTGHFA
ncbi:hypothetical protein [Streptomyces litchfieldiae]|uniref:Uncharacterized protein n=1 Tax=Streptomyces litchfieldiae TaxID=3075543 RepID=A0ABU2MXH0_9ACTN|nr:hypothetical protein [Streptomyces sp. DSM 44938]MDT0346186.1 hypothetical protein [Streptomyces sp. DSM 44938]